jgi:peptidoglycan-associated lipoprotein
MRMSLLASLSAVAVLAVSTGCASRSKSADPSTTVLDDASRSAPAATPAADDDDAAKATALTCRADADCGAGNHCSPAGTCAEGARCDLTVHFEYDESQLSSEARDALASAAECIRARKWASVRIEGHSDERGTTEYNLHLGQRRAESVQRYLKNLGLAIPMDAVTYGEEMPVSSGSGEAQWAQNRRAEVRSASSSGPAAMVR